MSVKKHLERADENLRRFQISRREWAPVYLFYSAVHLVQAHALHTRRYGAVGSGGPPKVHSARNAYVSKVLPEIALEYLRLKAQSEDARYDLWVPPDSELPKLEQDYQKVRERVMADVP
jgi:hypothetical protein